MSPPFGIDLLVVVELEIDRAAFAEARHRDAGFRVECDQPVANRDVKNPLFFAVRPVSEAVAGKRPRANSRRAGPSFSLCIQSISPVAASSATTALRAPAVEYSLPFTISGVLSNRYSGWGPSASVLNRQATSSLLKLVALIWSSGEYRVFPGSPPQERHSPSLAPD